MDDSHLLRWFGFTIHSIEMKFEATTRMAPFHRGPLYPSSPMWANQTYPSVDTRPAPQIVHLLTRTYTHGPDLRTRLLIVRTSTLCILAFIYSKMIIATLSHQTEITSYSKTLLVTHASRAIFNIGRSKSI